MAAAIVRACSSIVHRVKEIDSSVTLLLLSTAVLLSDCALPIRSSLLARAVAATGVVTRPS